MLFACDTFNQPQLTEEFPVFGSLASSTIGFDNQKSDYNPTLILHETGTLKSKWLTSTSLSELKVSKDNVRIGAGLISNKNKDGSWITERESFNFPADHLLISIGEKTVYPFEASYEEFVLFPCDIDNDGINEIILEHGIGRGTSAYVRYLSILKAFDAELIEVLCIPLNGYLPSPESPDGEAWQRTYHFVRTFAGELDISVILIPPTVVPNFISNEEYLNILQHPVLVFTYDPKKKTFLIKREEFRREL